MALSASTVWELRTTGSDTNGGGFVTGASGTDWSQQDTAQYSVTDAVTNGTTTITSATASFGTDVVGNILYIQGGTAPITAGWYQIISRTDASTIVVDRSTGLTTGTGATLKIGGSLATFAAVQPLRVEGNIIWVKATASYTISSTLSLGLTGSIWYLGYTTTRGDNGRATILAGANSISILYGSSSGGGYFANFIVDNNSRTGVTAFNGNVGFGSTVTFRNCKAISTATGFTIGMGARFASTVVDCEADSCTTGFSLLNAGFAFGCYAKSCTTGFNFGGNNESGGAAFCISSGGTTGFTRGNATSGSGGPTLFNCTAYGASGDGIKATTYSGGGPMVIQNCISYGNGGYGITSSNVQNRVSAGRNNAYGANTSGNLLNIPASNGDVTLTGNPFTDAANRDFSLNNTAGAGAACRAAGYPGVFPSLSSTTGYLDIGAVQHQDSGGGSSVKGMRILGG